jgi:hypothetical protein
MALALLCPAAAMAQTDTTARGDVRGTVYDSIAHAALSGPVVQMMDPEHPGRVQSVTADAKGRFAFTAVVPGRYLVGFQHPRLDSLALETPTRVVDVRAGETAKVDLALPSSASVNAAVCGSTGLADSTGLVIGLLQDASTEDVLTTGTVQVAWQDLVLQRGQFVPEDQFLSAVIQPTGWYALCHVPADIDVLGRAYRGRDSTGYALLRVSSGGLVRRDFAIGGVTRLHGSVRSERGQPLANARVVVAGTERGAYTDSSGAFNLSDIAAGTQTIELRALGYVPETRELTLQANADTAVDVTLTSFKKVLDTIHVVATRLYNRDSNGFERRRKMGFGSYVDDAMIAKRRPFDMYSLLYGIPSMQIVNRGFDRSVLMRGMKGLCAPNLFLNGMRMSSDLAGQLDVLVRPEEVAGMEVYRPGNVPAEFFTFDNCGAIVIWTKPPGAPPTR